jgi:flavin-dependent dehydrogenase
MRQTYDAIVVGARCAGSPTAMLLARAGHRVLLVDKARFPSDTMSSHFIHPTGVARLSRWGLLDPVRASGCPPISRWRFDFGFAGFTGSPPPVDGVAEALAPRRTVLDQILIEAAAKAGAEVREGFTVEGVESDGGRVTGIRGRDASGRTVRERSRVVVGADGRHSRVARWVDAPEYNAHPTLTCAYYGYWSGVPVEGAEVYARDRRLAIAFPTNDQRTLVFVEWPAVEFDRFRADVEGSFMSTVDLLPELAVRVRGGERVGRLIGTGVLPNFFRQAHGPGWALVGDAGYHKDPYLAQGISDAFRDAELLADALNRGLGGSEPVALALAGYASQRDAAAAPAYELDLQLATLQPPPPERQALIGALEHDQTEANRFIGTLMGTVAVEAFFAPANIERIVAAPPGQRVPA